jgi:HlyD family secretion protein
MKRVIGIVIAAVLVGLFAWTVVYLYGKSRDKPVEFKTEKPARADIVKKTIATGSLIPRREVEIKPRVSGVVETLWVEPGQKVKAGDQIAKIKIIPNVVSLNAAESSVKTSQINLENAQRELERARSLFAQKLISEAELSRRQVDHDLRRQELSSARSNLQLIRSGAAKGSGKVSNVVTSTVDGMVIEVPVKEGESVTETNNFNPGTTIAFVADMTDMIFQGYVDESEVGKIKEGMSLAIRVGALEDHKFTGKLEYIAPKGATIEGAIQFEIKAAVKLKESVFVRANYSANADIVLDRADGVLAINEALLQFGKGGKPFVEVEVGDKIFERRDIELGLSDGVKVEVKKGLSESDAIKLPRAIEGEGKKRGGRG